MDDLRAAIAMTAAEDMPDMVKAKLFKVTGLMLSDCGDYAQALEHLARAMQLDGHAGVRKRSKNVKAPSSRSRRPPQKNNHAPT